MKKLLSILLILFVGFAAFAQDSVVVYYADDLGPSQDNSMFYAGIEAGASSMNNLIIDMGAGNISSISPLVGFEVTPVFGFRPFDNTNFSMEINVMMDMLFHTAYGIGVENTDVSYMTQVASPQVVFMYTFGNSMIRPFAGLGMGANFNYMETQQKETNSEGKLETVKSTYKIDPSFSMVLKGGVKVSIPNTNFDIYGTCKYNVNIPTKLVSDGNTIKNEMNASALSVALGMIYNF